MEGVWKEHPDETDLDTGTEIAHVELLVMTEEIAP